MIGFRSQLMMIMERLMLARMQRKAVVLSVRKNLLEPGLAQYRESMSGICS